MGLHTGLAVLTSATAGGLTDSPLINMTDRDVTIFAGMAPGTVTHAEE